MDFIKQYPSMTFEDFFWRFSAPMVRLMSMDCTYVKYLTEKQAKKLKTQRGAKEYTDPDKFINDLGIPCL